MRTVIMILFLCNFLNVFSQTIPSDKDKYNLKGWIESVFSTKYYASFDSLKNVIKGDYYDIGRRDIFESKLLSINSFNAPENSLCLFDKEGNVNSILYFYEKVVKLRFAEVRTRVNDSVSQEIFYLPDEISLIYEVYERNNEPYKRIVISEGNDTLKALYTYSNGKAVKNDFFENDVLQVSGNYEYTNGRVSKKTFISGNKIDTILVQKCTYNQFGDLETEIVQNKYDFYEKRYEYKYDNMHNWTVCYEYKGNDIEAITERKIKYYDK